MNSHEHNRDIGTMSSMSIHIFVKDSRIEISKIASWELNATHKTHSGEYDKCDFYSSPCNPCSNQDDQDRPGSLFDLFGMIRIGGGRLQGNCGQLCKLVYSSSGQVTYAYYKGGMDAARCIEIHYFTSHVFGIFDCINNPSSWEQGLSHILLQKHLWNA